jgi:hypothetical protein
MALTEELAPTLTLMLFVCGLLQKGLEYTACAFTLTHVFVPELRNKRKSARTQENVGGGAKAGKNHSDAS